MSDERENNPYLSQSAYACLQILQNRPVVGTIQVKALVRKLDSLQKNIKKLGNVITTNVESESERKTRLSEGAGSTRA